MKPPIVLPDAVVVEEAATVDRYRCLEAGIDSGDDAGQVATPADAGECRALRIHFGQREQQRVGEDHVCDRVVAPHVADIRFVEGAEFSGIGLVWPAILESLLVRPVASRVHRDRDIPALRPVICPCFERLTPSAVHEDNPRERTLASRPANIGEDSRRPPLERLAFVEDRAHQPIGLRPLSWWRLGQPFHVPQQELADRLAGGKLACQVEAGEGED